MRTRWVLGALALGGLLGCIDSRFLRGAKCSDDRDCGRSLECIEGVCGGCPDDIDTIDGRCPCPGDRVLDCRVLSPAPRCMPVCATATELCRVVEIVGESLEAIPACDEMPDGERCVTVELDATACPEGEAEIVLTPADPDAELVVNCPPPESEEARFDCEAP